MPGDRVEAGRRAPAAISDGLAAVGRTAAVAGLPLYYEAIALLVLLCFPLTLAVAVCTAPFDPHRLAAGGALRLLGRLAVRLVPVWGVELEGSLPSSPRPFVVVPNHESIADALAIAHLPREVKWIVKRGVLLVPWFGWALALAGHVSVLRGDRRSGSAALGRLRRYLDRGVRWGSSPRVPAPATAPCSRSRPAPSSWRSRPEFRWCHWRSWAAGGGHMLDLETVVGPDPSELFHQLLLRDGVRVHLDRLVGRTRIGHSSGADGTDVFDGVGGEGAEQVSESRNSFEQPQVGKDSGMPRASRASSWDRLLAERPRDTAITLWPSRCNSRQRAMPTWPVAPMTACADGSCR